MESESVIPGYSPTCGSGVPHSELRWINDQHAAQHLYQTDSDTRTHSSSGVLSKVLVTEPLCFIKSTFPIPHTVQTFPHTHRIWTQRLWLLEKLPKNLIVFLRCLTLLVLEPFPGTMATAARWTKAQLKTLIYCGKVTKATNSLYISLYTGGPVERVNTLIVFDHRMSSSSDLRSLELVWSK